MPLRRQLRDERQQLTPERAHRLSEAGQIVLPAVAVQRTTGHASLRVRIVGDALGQLGRESEAVWGTVPPGVDDALGRDGVERAVDLREVEGAGVASQPVPGLEAPRVEHALPV